MFLAMTPREALRIQAEQIEYYKARYPQLEEAAKQATNIDGLDLDAPLSMREINRRIPRGCSLGWLIGQNF